MKTEAATDASVTKPSGTARSGPSRPRGHVTIFGTWCKGCGICIEFCPQDVFEANGQGRPVIVRADRCTACNWCSVHCPDMAITVRRLDAEEIEELQELAGLAEQGVLPAGGDL